MNKNPFATIFKKLDSKIQSRNIEFLEVALNLWGVPPTSLSNAKGIPSPKVPGTPLSAPKASLWERTPPQRDAFGMGKIHLENVLHLSRRDSFGVT